MAELKLKIEQDLKAALKRRDQTVISVLRLLLAEIHNQEIEKKSLTQEDEMAVLVTAAKKHRDSITQFKSGGRAELAAKEEAELQIIQSYLPVAMPEDELRALVGEVLMEEKAATEQDFGKVMKRIMPKIKGRADGALVSSIVKESLANLKGKTPGE